MGKKGSIRRVYPGGNTYRGFYSFYDYILDQKEANQIVIIKGGPGVGKSLFMKKLGEEMYNRGFDVEYHHCSSDNNSVDGVVFPEIAVAFIDGTAPHVVDPKNPGGVDKIIYFGDYWNEEKLMDKKFNIIKANTEIGRNFKRAYGYLTAAKGVYDNIKENIDEAIDWVKVNKITEQLMSEIFSETTFSDRLGKKRHLFGSAITPDGIKDHLETIVEPNEVIYLLEGSYDSAQSYIMEKIADVAVNKGYRVELFHNHFIPEKVDHIVINDLSVAITTSSKFNSINNKVICIDSCLSKDLLDQRSGEIKLDIDKCTELINLAVSNITVAKKIHDRMEEYYIPNMDFKEIDKLRVDMLNRILEFNK